MKGTNIYLGRQRYEEGRITIFRFDNEKYMIYFFEELPKTLKCVLLVVVVFDDLW